MLDKALELDRAVKVAMELASCAGEALRRFRDAPERLEQRRKDDKTLVTEADLESDRIIREGLLTAFPDDGVLTEESGLVSKGESERTWVVDPLDGTRAYVAQGDDYAVQIGLLVGGVPQLGVVHEPETGRFYYAIRGIGAFLTTGGLSTVRQLKVSHRSELGKLRFITSASASDAARAELVAAGFQDVGTAHSVGFKVGRIVRREADVYYSFHPVHYWDSCAPMVVLEAAGGKMTMLDGSPLGFELDRAGRESGFAHEGLFVATNGKLHATVCAELDARAGR